MLLTLLQYLFQTKPGDVQSTTGNSPSPKNKPLAGCPSGFQSPKSRRIASISFTDTIEAMNSYAPLMPYRAKPQTPIVRRFKLNVLAEGHPSAMSGLKSNSILFPTVSEAPPSCDDVGLILEELEDRLELRRAQAALAKAADVCVTPTATEEEQHSTDQSEEEEEEEEEEALFFDYP
jgi:hypothetical protein